MKSLTRADLIAIILSLGAVLAAYLVAARVFEGIAHLEDEFAYLWQAQVIADGKLTVPSPPSPRHFLVPFVVDFDGQRFGKYPLGWPVLLGIGERLGVRAWVNPVLAGLAVWLTYRLGKRTMGEFVGLLAALLTLTSPFFLLNSGSLLSHPLGLVLSLAFVLSWLDAFGSFRGASGSRLALVVAAVSIGLLALTRPLTAIAVALPFALHGIYLLVRGDNQIRRRLVAFAALGLGLASLHFVWQYAVTGDPFLNPYTLWWSYDKVGFGPGFGRYGHNLRLANLNTRFSLWVGWRDLFGWGAFSWVFLPLGFWAIRRNLSAFLAGSVYFSLVAVYMLYWVGSWLFGPRYYYEGLFSLTLVSGAGIAFLAGWPLRAGEAYRSRSGWAKARPLAVTAIVAFLVAMNLVFYTPLRLESMHALYGIERANVQSLSAAEAQGLAPALIVVHPDHWTEYGNLLAVTDPALDTPFVVVITRGPQADAALAQAFPDRTLYHYFPDDPFTFIRSGP